MVIIDQITKLLTENINMNIFNFFSLTYVKNTGAVFGILPGFRILFIILSIIGIIFLLIFASNDKKNWLPYSLITAGIFGNFIDRIFLGYVRDFINLTIWPVFNIADSSICIGVFIIVYSLIKKK